MPLAIALIFCVVLFAVFLVGVAWALAVLVPFYAYVGLAIYLVWKSARRQADVEAAVARDAERQRSFNEREMRAWNALIEKGSAQLAKHERALGRPDQAGGDPPQSMGSTVKYWDVDYTVVQGLGRHVWKWSATIGAVRIGGQTVYKRCCNRGSRTRNRASFVSEENWTRTRA